MLLSGKQVFVVEDNPQNRVVFQMALIRHGALVTFERRGSDTMFRLSQAYHIDVIVLDLMLAQEVSGFDLFQEIRATPKFEKVPIIAVSAMDFAVGAPKARELGFDGFISKPIDNYLFPQQIAAIISGEKVWYENGRKFS